MVKIQNVNDFLKMSYFTSQPRPREAIAPAIQSWQMQRSHTVTILPPATGLRRSVSLRKQKYTNLYNCLQHYTGSTIHITVVRENCGIILKQWLVINQITARLTCHSHSEPHKIGLHPHRSEVVQVPGGVGGAPGGAGLGPDGPWHRFNLEL